MYKLLFIFLFHIEKGIFFSFKNERYIAQIDNLELTIIKGNKFLPDSFLVDLNHFGKNIFTDSLSKIFCEI